MKNGMLLLLALCGCASMTYSKSDHCDGRVFFNTDPNARELKSLADVLKWRFTSTATPWPPSLPEGPMAQITGAVPEGKVRVTMVNHATLLLQFAGYTVLTDPVYSERASPVQFAGPKRVRLPGIPIDKLPRIDAIVISHNHYDHLDLPTLKRLHQIHRPQIVVPLGTRALLAGAGMTQVTELDWWQSITPKAGLRITCVEAQHWAARGLLDRNHALWGGYVVSVGGVQAYFAGDTGYGSHFQRIRERLGRIDLALLPIGAYAPRWFMRSQHMDPDDAVRAHLDLQARQSVGIHFGTFQLTDEGIDEPPRLLVQALAERGVDGRRFRPLYNGEGLTLAP